MLIYMVNLDSINYNYDSSISNMSDKEFKELSLNTNGGAYTIEEFIKEFNEDEYFSNLSIARIIEEV